LPFEPNAVDRCGNPRHGQSYTVTTDGYDQNGNTISRDGATYAYDFSDRLKSKNGSDVSLVYNGDGALVAKTAGGVTTKYLVDDLNPTGYSQVLEEVVAAAVKQRYTYGTMLISTTGWKICVCANFAAYRGHEIRCRCRHRGPDGRVLVRGGEYPAEQAAA
jgi:hypothetical protein